MSFRISHDQMECLHTAILDRFDRQSFEEFLFFKVNRKFGAIVTHAAFKYQAFEVLSAANDEEWMAKLVKELALERPTETAFTELRDQIGTSSQESLMVAQSMLRAVPDRESSWQGVASLARPVEPEQSRSDPFRALPAVHAAALREFQEILERISLAIAGRRPGQSGGAAFQQVLVVLDAGSMPNDEEVIRLLREAANELGTSGDPIAEATAVTCLGARACARAQARGDYDEAMKLARMTQVVYSQLLAYLSNVDVPDLERSHWRIEELTWQMQKRLADLLSIAASKPDRTRQPPNQQQGDFKQQPPRPDQTNDMVNSQLEEAKWAPTNAARVRSQRT